VLDYTNTPTIERELLLAKVSILGPEHVQAQLSGPVESVSFDHAISDQSHSHGAPSFVESGHPSDTQSSSQSADADKSREQALARSFENAALPPGVQRHAPQGGMSMSEGLIARNLHFSAISNLATQFGGKITDVSENAVIVELTAKSSRVDAFLSLMRPFGVLEAARSGELSFHSPSSNLNRLPAGRTLRSNRPMKDTLIPFVRRYGATPVAHREEWRRRGNGHTNRCRGPLLAPTGISPAFR